MKKLLILTLAMCLLASASFATYTRVKTMGNNNMVLHDEYNIWMFPSTLYDYPEMFVGEFTNTDAFVPPALKSANIDGYGYGYDYGGYVSGFGMGNIPHLGSFEFYENGFTNLGAHFKFNEENPFIVGVYFTKSETYTPFNFVHPDYYWFESPDLSDGNNLTLLQNQRIDLFYAKMMGENKLGVHLGWVYSGNSIEDTDFKPTLSMNVLNLGLGYTAMENKLDLGLDFKMMTWTSEDQYGYKYSEPDGAMTFMLAGRYFNEMNQKITLVPHGKIMYEKFGVKYYDDTDDDTATPTVVTDKDTFTGFKIDGGLGMNYAAAAGVTAVTDFGIKFQNQKMKYEPTGGTSTEDKLSSITAPYFKVGLEATVFDWFDLRMGGIDYWMWETFTNTSDRKYKEKYVMTEFYLGGAFHWGNLNLDTYVNPQILNDGLYFVNGSYTYPFAYQVSLKYKMF